MYENAKSCVMVNNDISEFFVTYTGVRQGENLSPLLFALFLNDLKEELSKNMNRLVTITEAAEKVGFDDDFVFCKLFLLLYADDTIIYSETVDGLQKGLSRIKEYCERWKLKLNTSKCKVVVFSHEKIRKKNIFIYWRRKT